MKRILPMRTRDSVSLEEILVLLARYALMAFPNAPAFSCVTKESIQPLYSQNRRRASQDRGIAAEEFYYRTVQ